MVILSRVWWFEYDDAGPVEKRLSLSAAAAAAILRRTIIATRLIYFLYQVVQLALSPVVALYLLYRGIRNRGYFAHLGERLGLLPDSFESTGPGVAWFHAVSVGEVLSSVELIRCVRERAPYLKIFVSVGTLAGRAAAIQRLEGLVQGVFYAPLDYRSMVRRVLRRLRPQVVVILETEIWPNLYREAKRAGASLLVINGRISGRAFPRYRRWSGFFRHVLCWPDAILVQTARDAERFVLAGAPRDRVHEEGNLKYDFAPPSRGVPPDIAQFIAAIQPEAVWIAASTDLEEEDAICASFQELAQAHARLLLVLAPRRPERFNPVAHKLTGLGVSLVRRSALSAGLKLPGILLLDSIGELAPVFELASVVFMGGTLAPRGGHNILEPAYFAKPVIAGPHMENFAAIAEEFTGAGALVRIAGPQELTGAVSALLNAKGVRMETGRRARDLAMSKRGASARIAGRIVEAAAGALPQAPRALVARVALTPLSWLWAAGHRRNMARSLAARQSLTARVVSVGAIGMGGAGKSPMVAYLARRLREAGRVPAILTRGYRKKSPDGLVIVPRGQTARVEMTGDEAQMFVRAGNAHVGIGAGRHAAGMRMERDLHPDVFLLDDGFQHLRLHRDLDIVLIDALDPLSGGLFPLGRRREPLEGLSRAGAIVVTRVEPGQNIAGIEAMLRRYNRVAPIFRSRVVPRQWVDVEWGTARETDQVDFRRVAAFCGLGSPRSFWRSLECLGLDVVFRWAFSDHHSYRPAELRRLAAQAAAAGAEALVTTEKDVMNLCEGAAALFAPRRLYWLRIEIEIDNGEELLRRIL